MGDISALADIFLSAYVISYLVIFGIFGIFGFAIFELLVLDIL